MTTEYWKRSQVTGKKYNYFSKDIVRIVNLKQAMAYISHKVELIDIYTSRDKKTNEPILIFVFDRESSQEAYDLWCDHKLYIKED